MYFVYTLMMTIPPGSYFCINFLIYQCIENTTRIKLNKNKLLIHLHFSVLFLKFYFTFYCQIFKLVEFNAYVVSIVRRNHINPTGYSQFMMTSSNGNIFRVTGPLCGEFTGPGEFPAQEPVTRGFDVFFDLRLNKWLSKQSLGLWFETRSRSLWRHRNVT